LPELKTTWYSMPGGFYF